MSNNFITQQIETIWRVFSPNFQKKMAVNWHVSNNFGDMLSVYIAKKLSGIDVLNVQENSSFVHYQIVGSILSLANEKSLVWGTGFANRTDSFIRKPKKVYMVRGEYSLEKCRRLGVRNDVALGDPGYIISRLYSPKKISKKYKFGVIPHWVDYEFCQALFKDREDILVIKLLNSDVEAVIDQILTCEKCMSSSLHGLIVSHSYNIPCIHVTFSDHILCTGLIKFIKGDDGVKFLDYFSSVKISEYTPPEIAHLDAIDDITDAIPTNFGDKNQINKMIAGCPFAKLSEVEDAYC